MFAVGGLTASAHILQRELDGYGRRHLKTTTISDVKFIGLSVRKTPTFCFYIKVPKSLEESKI